MSGAGGSCQKSDLVPDGRFNAVRYRDAGLFFNVMPDFEKRLRFIPSGLTDEVIQDVFTRVKSFEPEVTDIGKRLFDAYAYEVSLVDQNGDGVISFEEANVSGTSDGLPNARLYLPATAFDRFAVTREIDDGLLAPGLLRVSGVTF